MRSGLIYALLLGLAAVAGAYIAIDIFASAATPPDAGTRPVAAVFNDTTRDFLTPAEMQTALAEDLLPPGTKSLLRTEGRMRHGEYRWDTEGVPEGELTIWVDLRTQLISVFRGGHEIGTAVIVYGADTDAMASPLGRFAILSKQRDYHSRSYDAPMPYSLFITNTGVALHGSPMSSRRATHGCVGLPVEFAHLLYDAAATGDEVRITRSPASPEPHMASANR